jgi:hypothetical protein
MVIVNQGVLRKRALHCSHPPLSVVGVSDSLYEKQNHVQFYSSSHKFYGLLDLIFYYVFGPAKVYLISKALYYMSFFDDYSRRTWVYFLRTKYDIFSQLKEL